MNRIRQSEFQRFQRCPRSWYFGYELNMTNLVDPGQRRMPASGQRDAGSAAHAGVEVIHKGGTVDQALVAVLDYVTDTRAIRAPENLPALSQAEDPEWWGVWRLACRMVEGYVEWLEETGFDSGFETLAVEWEWEALLAPDITVYGKLDLAGRDHMRGGIVVDDVKSVASHDPVHPADFQLRTYAWAWWKVTGEAPVAAGHRQLRRVLRTPKAKPPFYDYTSVHINEDILIAHERQLLERARLLLNSKEQSVYSGAESPYLYPVPTKDCSWDCDFRVLCPMVDELSDWQDVLTQNFIVKSVNE